MGVLIRLVLHPAGRLVIGAMALGILLAGADLEALARLLRSVRPGEVMLALGLLGAGVAVGIVRWWLLLLYSVADRPRLGATGRVWMVGLFFNTFVPGGLAGDIIRGVRAGSEAGRRADGLASVFTDRFVGLVGLFGLAVPALVFRQAAFGAVEVHAGIVLVAVALALLGVAGYSRRGGRWLEAAMRSSRIAEPLGAVARAIRAYRGRAGAVATALALSLVAHLFMVTAVYVLGSAVGAPLSFGDALAFVPVVGILSALPISVNAVGIREGAYVALLATAGVSHEQALGIGLLQFSLTLVLAGVGGLIFVVDPAWRTPAWSAPPLARSERRA